MIKLEHEILPSSEQMKFIIEGMRNPMNSWDKSDSRIIPSRYTDDPSEFAIGDNDHMLMLKLAKAGTDHRKYLRMMPVYVRITAPLYWWKEFDTYKIATVANSCSTMHKIHAKEFVVDDFSNEHLDLDNYDLLKQTIARLNHYRDIYINGGVIEYPDCGRQIFESKSKKIWWQMIQLLPSSYNQTRNVMLNYEVLGNIYKSRRYHKLDEWREFCKWIEALPCSDLILAAAGISEEVTSDWIAREILAELAGGSVNETTNNLTKKIIFGSEWKPQAQFKWREIEKPVHSLPPDMEN